MEKARLFVANVLSNIGMFFVAVTSTVFLSLLFFVILCVLLTMITGCGWFTPTTKLQAGPWGSYFSFEDSKDNNITIEDSHYDPTTKGFRIGRLVIVNASSSVLQAQTERLIQINEQMRIHGENISSALNVLSGMLGTTVPFLSSRNTVTTEESFSDALLERIIEKVIDRALLRRSTETQPAPE